MIGLVLEGGGAKGAFQVGAYRALKELGIQINGVVGTSIGALNGALIAQQDEDKAYEVWKQISPSRLFNLSEKQFEKLVKLKISSSEIPFFLGKITEVVKNKGLDVSLIKDILNELIDEQKLRSSPIDFGLVTYSLTTMKPFELFIQEIPKGQLIDYLMASASFPIFKLEKLDGNLFIDGGVFDNMPINLLIKKGYRDIIAIRTFGLGVYKKISDSSVNVTYINPSEDLGGTLDFDPARAKKNINLGYFDTMKLYKKLSGKRYYITPDPNEDRIISLFLTFNDQIIKEVGSIFGFQDIPPKRMLFEYILPRLADLLCLSKENSYQDILIGICEELADDIPLERFHFYTVYEFIKTIQEKYNQRKENPLWQIPKFVRQNELLSRVVKDSLLEEIASKVILRSGT